jgi:hypothetical protein
MSCSAPHLFANASLLAVKMEPIQSRYDSARQIECNGMALARQSRDALSVRKGKQMIGCILTGLLTSGRPWKSSVRDVTGQWLHPRGSQGAAISFHTSEGAGPLSMTSPQLCTLSSRAIKRNSGVRRETRNAKMHLNHSISCDRILV